MYYNVSARKQGETQAVQSTEVTGDEQFQSVIKHFQAYKAKPIAPPPDGESISLRLNRVPMNTILDW